MILHYAAAVTGHGSCALRCALRVIRLPSPVEGACPLTLCSGLRLQPQIMGHCVRLQEVEYPSGCSLYHAEYQPDHIVSFEHGEWEQKWGKLSFRLRKKKSCPLIPVTFYSVEAFTPGTWKCLWVDVDWKELQLICILHPFCGCARTKLSGFWRRPLELLH